MRQVRVHQPQSIGARFRFEQLLFALHVQAEDAGQQIGQPQRIFTSGKHARQLGRRLRLRQSYSLRCQFEQRTRKRLYFRSGVFGYGQCAELARQVRLCRLPSSPALRARRRAPEFPHAPMAGATICGLPPSCQSCIDRPVPALPLADRVGRLRMISFSSVFRAASTARSELSPPDR